MLIVVIPEPCRRPRASWVRSTARAKGTGVPPAPRMVWLVGWKVPEKSQRGRVAGSKARFTCPEGATAKQRGIVNRSGIRKRRPLVEVIINVCAGEDDDGGWVRQAREEELNKLVGLIELIAKKAGSRKFWQPAQILERELSAPRNRNE